MKARIIKTGEIIRLSEYAKIELDICDSYGNPIELKPEEVELISDDNGNTSITDWSQVRVQASIGAMQVILGKNNYDTYKDIATQAVGYADALVEELKKRKVMSTENSITDLASQFVKEESSVVNPILPQDNIFENKGWQCPICGRVYSPTTPMCFYCGRKELKIT